MIANLISVLSDGTLLVGFVTSAVIVGRKIGWYERRIQDMDKRLRGACENIDVLDEKRQVSEKASARYEEKLDNVTDILKEVKSMILQHITNGKSQ
jgi:hypothetical protein